MDHYVNYKNTWKQLSLSTSTKNFIDESEQLSYILIKY